MGHETTIIKELDFVLTHPACNVHNIQNFYNNCLYVYESVPLLAIIEHMRKVRPQLLKEWATVNSTVFSLVTDLEEDQKEESTKLIVINIDLSGEAPASNGIYKITWEAQDLQGNSQFKKSAFLVIDKTYGQLELIGFSHIEDNRFYLYLKKGRISK